jgi:hypothetical protein
MRIFPGKLGQITAVVLEELCFGFFTKNSETLIRLRAVSFQGATIHGCHHHPGCGKKRITFRQGGVRMTSHAVLSRARRKWNDPSLLRRLRREGHALGLRDAVLAPQMPVGFHCQRAPVFVAEPA